MKNNSKLFDKLTILFITLMALFPIISITIVYFFPDNAMIMILILGAFGITLGIILIIHSLVDINKMFD